MMLKPPKGGGAMLRQQRHWSVWVVAVFAVAVVGWVSPRSALCQTQTKKTTIGLGGTRVTQTLPPLPKRPWTSKAKIRGISPRSPVDMRRMRLLGEQLLDGVVRVDAKLMKGTSQGSGFFINEQGWLITNYHVVSGAQSVTLKMRNGDERDADVIALDAVSDLALLYVPPRPQETFSFLALGDSDTAALGDWVVALGAPLRFDHTITTGIISALRRRGSRPKNPKPIKEYIQFDAAINPGSSGGALVNMSGEVVGVVTAMRKDGQGLYFAVPVQRLKRVLPRMMSGQSIRRSRAGLAFQPITPNIARTMGLSSQSPERNGALIRDVAPAGPADRAGLMPGDVVTHVDGVKLLDADDVAWLLATGRTDRDLPLRILRQGKPREVSIRLRTTLLTSTPRTSKTLTGPARKIGVGVFVPSPEARSAMSVSLPMRGVVVYAVAPRSAPERAGLTKKTIIEQVGLTPISSPSEFYQRIEEDLQTHGAVRVLARSGGSRRWLVWER